MPAGVRKTYHVTNVDDETFKVERDDAWNSQESARVEHIQALEKSNKELRDQVTRFESSGKQTSDAMNTQNAEMLKLEEKIKVQQDKIRELDTLTQKQNQYIVQLEKNDLPKAEARQQRLLQTINEQMHEIEARKFQEQDYKARIKALEQYNVGGPTGEQQPKQLQPKKTYNAEEKLQLLKNAEQRLKEKGRKLQQVNGEGSCFYNAIADQINTRFPHLKPSEYVFRTLAVEEECTKRHVREKAAAWLRGTLQIEPGRQAMSNDNLKYLRAQVENSIQADETWESWDAFVNEVEDKEGKNKWAGQHAIVAVSQAYNMPIKIWNTMGEEHDVFLNPQGVEDKNQFEILHELYGITEVHYQSVHFIDQKQDPASAADKIDRIEIND